MSVKKKITKRFLGQKERWVPPNDASRCRTRFYPHVCFWLGSFWCAAADGWVGAIIVMVFVCVFCFLAFQGETLRKKTTKTKTNLKAW